MTFNQLCDQHHNTMYNEYYHTHDNSYCEEEAIEEFVEEMACKCDECPRRKDCEMRIDYENGKTDEEILECDCKTFWEDEAKSGSKEFKLFIEDWEG